jgi:hypothetical protein
LRDFDKLKLKFDGKVDGLAKINFEHEKLLGKFRTV